MSKQKLSNISVTINRLKHIANALQLSVQTQQRAIELAGLKPDNAAWLRFIDRFLLICGVTLALVGIMSFFAYNWADLHKFGKFALIETGIFALVVTAYIKTMDKLSGKAALFGAAVLTGVLLAVYGQTYQTGADPYGLFLSWAILISGWVLIGRNAGLWLLLLVLANLSLIMYWTQLVHPEDWATAFIRELGPFAGITYSLTDFSLAQWVFSLNVLALVMWEFGGMRNIAWMHGRSFPRIIAIFALAPVAVSTLMFIFLSGAEEYWGIRWASPVLFTVFTVVALFYYSKKSPDMFILAAALLALIVIVTAVLARVIHAGFEMFFLLSILVIAQSAAAAQWLRKVKKAWEANT
jgi:uncharacterized membrane protein